MAAGERLQRPNLTYDRRLEVEAQVNRSATLNRRRF